MSDREINRRFKLVLLGYMIFALFVVAGIWINSVQTENIQDTQSDLIQDTERLARAIASGQAYLCDQIAFLSGEALLRGGQTIKIRCFTQEQRYNQIIRSLSSH